MNPIEDLWCLISKCLEKRAATLKEWEKIPLEYLRKLNVSMPQRVKDLYDVKRGHTRH
ncbi:hypothetical protein SAICODRAFT_29276 [Saitoella complicata NRRL Y-17804]|uniref:uncharacterized protein n=1 Tax=Saitoella complicata (strain BCRC 22490 / CBS 7301 / JCM 7358 / NBRC 10748 / NRRL Y-17804) TaxID=698492 RepID=UPI0008670EC2|nr:uncharacterized protein SAICODRAFT_29276 [Saitoella complicata NRRL Y-17804]ODQ55116.1 hypothetical protein SAICODRAFT_29276 [Saitoella complicata NRRL Y-17804]